MQKSLFTKYLAMTMSIVLASYIVLGSLMMYFFTDYWQTQKKSLLTKNAATVSFFASKYVTIDEQSGKATLDTSSGAPTLLLDLVAESVDSDVFITDLDGKIIMGTAGKDSEVSADFAVSKGVIQRATTTTYDGKGSLDGLYKIAHYTIGIPFIVKNAEGDSMLLGAVFASTNASEVTAYIYSSLKMFLMAALMTLLLTFIVVWLYTYKMIKPLRRMSQATKAFATGDFSIRVPVESSDEIGQLSAAFNNMATVLSNSEGMRRSFVANVSHELKTPMTTIGGFIDGILDGTIPPERQSQYLKIVSSEVKRLARLVKSMLDLSRIDSGEMKINPVKFDITATVCSTLLTFEQKIDDKNLEIRGLDTAGPVNILGDQDLLHQVIYNLIENAVKFTETNGYINFNIADSFDRVCVSIENSGEGIPPDDLPLIFDKFYKSDKSRSRDKNGMGLGLYLVQTIVKLHNGDITVQSAVSGLTRFEFYLPKTNMTKTKDDSVINLSATQDIDIQDVE